MSDAIDIAASLAAHAQVKRSIDQLRDQLSENARAIGKVEGAIKHLEQGYPPLPALKKAIVDHALAWSEELARREVTAGIQELGSRAGAHHAALRKPLSYTEVLKNLPAIGLANPGNVSALTKVMFSEHALHYLCRDVIKAKLTALVDGLSPGTFGYDIVSAEQIGPGWADREKQLSELSKKLGELQAQRVTITDNLVQLGVPRNNIWGD